MRIDDCIGVVLLKCVWANRELLQETDGETCAASDWYMCTNEQVMKYREIIFFSDKTDNGYTKVLYRTLPWIISDSQY